MTQTTVKTIKISAGAVFGLILLVLGVLLTLDSLGILELGSLWRWWPVSLVALGVSMLVLPGGSRGGGIVLSAVGVFLLLEMRWDVFWPFLLILIGGTILWHSIFPASRRRRWHGREGGCCPEIGEVVALGGKEVRSDSKDFKGGSATAIMGGVDLDLRHAGTGPSGAVLDVFVLMGGVEVRVPEDWEVTNTVTPIMGAYEDKRRPSPAAEGASPSGQLTIRGTVLMGGVEVKN